MNGCDVEPYHDDVFVMMQRMNAGREFTFSVDSSRSLFRMLIHEKAEVLVMSCNTLVGICSAMQRHFHEIMNYPESRDFRLCGIRGIMSREMDDNEMMIVGRNGDVVVAKLKIC